MKWVLIGLAVGVGMMLPFQAAMNAEIGRRAGHGIHGATWNFVLGLAVLTAALAVFLVLRKASPPDLSAAFGAPWWAFFGGMIGAALVLTSLTLVPRIGAVALLAGIVVGQSVGSVVIDQFGLVNVDPRPITVLRAVGVVLLVAGIVVIAVATEGAKPAVGDGP